MKILYIATSFPELSKGATIYTDLAEALNEAGHEVIVAVSEQARNNKSTEMKKERGFDVLRIKTGNYYDVGWIEKGITMLKIPILMRIGITNYLRHRRFDMILFESPPITNAGLVAWAKKKFRCPAYLMLKDIFPQNAVDLQLIKYKSLLFKYFRKKEINLYKTADIIGCMSLANKNYIIKHNSWIDARKIEIFPNTKKITDSFLQEGFPMRERYGISKETCVFLFGGNMGRPQYVDLLCNAVKKCRDEENIYFLFVGRGTDRYKIEQTIKENNIKNALAIENLPRDEFEQITKECDIGLIVLDPRFTIPNFPSRILSYMEYAKPVLAATDNVTDIRDLIEDANCGEWVWSADSDAFVAKVKEMSVSKELLTKGNNGRKYIEDNFKVECSIDLIEKYFKSSIQER